MNYNYHKRLVTNYLSQPKYGLHKTNSEHAYITAAKTKYFNGPVNNNYGSQNRHTSIPYCQLCNMQTSRRKAHCTHNNKMENNVVSSQYYEPEIKTIRNALLDIRDQMKNKGKTSDKFYMQNHQRQRQSNGQRQNQLNRYYKQFEAKYLQKEKQFRILEIRNQELSHSISELQKKNHHLLEDLRLLQDKNKAYEFQIQQRRNRLNRAQIQKNQALQRQRSLQIKIMNLRADLMSKQQLIREMNLNESQFRQKQMAKKFMMGPSQEISMVVWNKQGYKQERSTQTNLSQVDIEKGFRQLNSIQDNLCQKINGNLKIERKIFARIAQVDEKLNSAYDKLFRVQQEASRLGINIRNMGQTY